MDILKLTKPDMDFNLVKGLNPLAKETARIHNEAFKILETGNVQNYEEGEAEYYLNQIQSLAEYIPASEQFMKNVKRRFKDKQINFTIQNYLTWHHIDAILITYFKTGDRFEKFKECAVTELDNIFVDSLEKLIQNNDLSTDQLRYAYFVHTLPRMLRYFYYYTKNQEQIDKDFETLTKSERGAQQLDITTLYAMQSITYETDIFLHMHVQRILEKRKSQYGALPHKINQHRYGNILYKGITGQYKDLEKGEVIIKEIKSLSDEKEYFKDRQNAYKLLTIVENSKIKGAYINNCMVGVVGYTEKAITNIHVDGDYRLKGISKKLLLAILDEQPAIGITPIGDSFEYVKKISKYVSKNNQGLITKETLLKKPSKKEIPTNFKIEDSTESCINLASEQFKKYLTDNYDLTKLSVKVATINSIKIGYIAFDKKDKKIVLLEVSKDYNGLGIGDKLVKSVVDYNIWKADIASTGLLFWYGKGVTDDTGTVYISSSQKRLNKFAKDNNIKHDCIPKMYIL